LGKLSIDNNASLSSLAGLEQIDYTSITNMIIKNNPLLSNCNESLICNYLSNGGQADIQNNTTGCNSELEILNSCGFSKTNYQIFYDLNQNKVRDIGELIYPDAGIHIEPDFGLHYSNQEDGGILFLEEGNYEIIYDNSTAPDWGLTTDSTSYHFNIEATYSCDTFYFGVYPSREYAAMSAHLNAPPARCNEFVPFDIHTKNRGTTIINGTLWLEIDDRIEGVQFVDPPDTTVAPNRYGWHFYDLYPGHTVSRKILLQIPGPPDFPLGERLDLTSHADFHDSNGQYQSPIFVYDPEVRCSYDPNDKLVNPNRESKETLFEEELIYTIRFQNTGNDVAYDVVVLDTLDDNLDVSTFEILSSSHPQQLLASMEDGRYLTFNFKDIFLPDSTTNLEGSQGYISYVISPVDGLPEKTAIYNTASIYFDSNPPIVTNTTESILVSELTTTVHELEEGITLSIFPNPTNGQLYLQSSADFEGELQVTDHIGRRILQRAILNSQEVDLSQQSSGIYFITVQTKKGRVVEKVLKF